MEILDFAPAASTHISASSITTYTGCPHKWDLQYNLKKTFPSKSPSVYFGSCIHKALEAFHKSAFINLLTLAELQGIFDTEFERETFFNENIEWASEKDKTKMIKQAHEILSDYFYIHKKDPVPLEYIVPATGEKVSCIEMMFKVPITNRDGSINPDIAYLGYIDKITRDQEGKIVIVDYKTAARRYENWKVTTDLQLIIYAYAFRYFLQNRIFPELDIEKESYVQYEVLLKNLSKKDQEEGELRIQPCKKYVTDDDIKRLATQTDFCIKGIKAGAFCANYEGKWCDYCDFNVNFEDNIPICLHPKYN